MPKTNYDVCIVGAGAAGIATASSLLKRKPTLNIALIDASASHVYQPGWTLVGAGIFNAKDTTRSMASVIPKGVTWVQQAAVEFKADSNSVVLDNDDVIEYKALVVAPGLKLDFDAIEGLTQTLGQHGVTSNYRYDLAPYTWQLVQQLKQGSALFTQPPMPIKCAGAPQKALYLSADWWQQKGLLNNIKVAFHNAGGVLFGVPAYVPALMDTVEGYGIDLQLNSQLVKVDGPTQTATFNLIKDGAVVGQETKHFDMLHVCPPQTAHDFMRGQPIADAAGWVNVTPDTLQNPHYSNVFGLGDGANTPNAKTAAAVRKQAPVVAQNILSLLAHKPLTAIYDGYGSCPLTVSRRRIVLAEFGYGGKLLPTFPTWFLDGTKPTRRAWWLKAKAMPSIYWNLMLKGREWLTKP
ncbi:MAG: FAD/NAD(P)-binding oxidoreductase [Gammaproteobacteria bacterium]|nr:FAD/NAD(P)-binding oxidoreductase [Gammaproteobacteria bacterium]